MTWLTDRYRVGALMNLSVIALLVSGLAAVLGVRAATVHVRDNMDEFINDLHKQGRWASFAAIAAAVATALQALQQLLFTASTYDFP